jgi:hypothetical protein
MSRSANLPISYEEFLRHLRSLKNSGLDTSKTGDRLLLAAKGWHHLQGHVRQTFFGVQLFLLHNKSLIPSIAAFDVRQPMPLEGKMLRRWLKFLAKNKGRRNRYYDMGVLRQILPTRLGGSQTSGGGAMTFVGRSIVPIAQLLFKKQYGSTQGRAQPTTQKKSLSRRKQTILRIIRDTAMIQLLKLKYGFACQVCGFPSVEIGPSRYYVEGNHLRPLGKPHSGKDTKDNIVLLCPNHHVLFDNFAMSIDPHDCKTIVSTSKKLMGRKILSKHRLRPENVRYHYMTFKSLNPRFRTSSLSAQTR